MMTYIRPQLFESLIRKISMALPNDYYVPYKPNPKYQISIRGQFMSDHPLTDIWVEISSKLSKEIIICEI